jgi:hypothetical protein
MKNLVFILAKALLLLAIATAPFLPKFTALQPSTCYYTAGALAIIYLIVGAYEILQNENKLEGELIRFVYQPFIILTKKLLRICLFMIIAVILIAPETTVYELEPAVGTLVISEILFLLISLKRKKFNIAFFADYIFFSQEKEKKIFAPEILHVEYRYEIFYLVLHNKQTFKINPEYIPAESRKPFHDYFMEWTDKNAVQFTLEAKEKLFPVLR